MTPEERYLFDLQGYLVLRQVMSSDLVEQINAEIDRLETLDDKEAASLGIMRAYHQKKEPDGSDFPQKTAREESGPSRSLDYDCNALRLGGPFEELIDCPATLPYIEAMISDPVRLDSYAFMSRNRGQRSPLHHGYAELLPYSEFAIENGQFKCISLKIAYALTDVSVEEGAFVVMPGSHKSNFNNPFAGSTPDEKNPLIQVCPCKAGDAVIFSEDITHGAMMNKSNKTRRTLFISYAPAFQSPWGKLVDTADGFEERANASQLALIKGPSPFAVAPKGVTVGTEEITIE